MDSAATEKAGLDTDYRALKKNIYLTGATSFFNDFSTEMIDPGLIKLQKTTPTPQRKIPHPPQRQMSIAKHIQPAAPAAAVPRAIAS